MRSNGTTSAVSCCVASVHTMPRNGRTQRSEEVGIRAGPEAAPQRIDFGHGNARMIWGTISAMASLVSRPGFSIRAT